VILQKCTVQQKDLYFHLYDIEIESQFQNYLVGKF
jgi:hypothetical protein